MKDSSLIVRDAALADVPGILSLIQPYVERGIVLPRSEENCRENIGNFRVAEQGGHLIGCVALRNFGGNLYELRSLVVDAEHQGTGVGAKLVQNEVSRLRDRQREWKIFTLTTTPDFFIRQGFRKVDFRFPEKIWHDCDFCPKKDRCDEVPLLITSADPLSPPAGC